MEQDQRTVTMNAFTLKKLRARSLSTLYEIRRAEKESEGTFFWYCYPGNIRKVLKIAIDEKLKARKNDKRIEELMIK